MNARPLALGLIRDVFYGPGAADRLHARMTEAKERGAELACIPELGCNRWAPASKEALDIDAEDPNGPLFKMQSDVCKDVGIGLIGGAIVRDPHTTPAGKRQNTAMVFDKAGKLLSTYSKCHLPEEPGFWETSHYEPGELSAPVIDHFGFPFGVQICSDNNRPEGTHILAAMGAMAVIVPRATEAATFWKWRPIFIANALTSGCYVLSVDRPSPELGVGLGQPTIVVAPNGDVLVESTDPVTVVTVDPAAVHQARKDYPGYLPVRADMYAKAWAKVAEQQGKDA